MVSPSTTSASRTFFWLSCVPIGRLKFARTGRLLNLDCVLQGVHLRDIPRIGRVDQGADCRQGVARADLIPRERVAPGPIDDREHVMILVDHDHRHEAIARVRVA